MPPAVVACRPRVLEVRILLLGGSGQVGAEVQAWAAAGSIDVLAPGRAEFDLKDPSAIARITGAGVCDAVINTAAYTDVDGAESEEAAAFAINAEAPSRISVETARLGIPIIHISTDYVFDGRKGVPYLEHDKIGPVNAYGRSKAAGEQGVRSGNPRHVILRTSWVFSHRRKNFVKTILRLAAQRDQLKIVSDQRGCPTSAQDVARASLDIAKRCIVDPQNVPYGTYHFAAPGEASWFEFATAIICSAGSRLAKPPELVPIATQDYPTAAMRPLDTRLDCSAIAQKFNIKAQPWHRALDDTVDRILSSEDVS